MSGFERARAIYRGNNGDATKAFYIELEAFGPIGIIAMNLFRASKRSERAKAYARRRYRDAAYDVKQWSMENLCRMLTKHAPELGIVWGWGRDDRAVGFEWVLYVEIPTGQVSFHTSNRGEGPDYGKPWDGMKGESDSRICTWVGQILDGAQNGHQANNQ